jgi:hypothetical protein
MRDIRRETYARGVEGYSFSLEAPKVSTVWRLVRGCLRKGLNRGRSPGIAVAEAGIEKLGFFSLLVLSLASPVSH